MKKYMAYDFVDRNFEFYEREEDAIKAAEKMLDYYRDNAHDDGWPEELEGSETFVIGYAEIKMHVREVPGSKQTREEWLEENDEDDEDNSWPNGDFDSIMDYELIKTEEK